MIPYGKQEITQEDIDAVIGVLKSDFLTQGPKVPQFEEKLAAYCEAEYACAVNSATSALHIACLALGVGDGDEVWTTPISFVASANCAIYCGANVSFVDINAETNNMCPQSLEVKLIERSAAGKPLPKVVIPVHLTGLPCEMEEIAKLGKKYGFKIIEDASHAIGGRYKNKPVGACEFSDITVFSFHPVKIITTAEGGAALTNSKKLAEKMALYRSHGVTREEGLMKSGSHGPWYYQQVDLGFNYRMTELQAALGVSQISRLDDFVSKRHKLAMRYIEKLRHLPIDLPVYPQDSYSGLHLFVIKIDPRRTKVDRLEAFNKLRLMGVGVNVHYIPIHTQPFYLDMGHSEGDYPQAEKYYSLCISLPMYHLLSYETQDEVVKAMEEVFAQP